MRVLSPPLAASPLAASPLAASLLASSLLLASCAALQGPAQAAGPSGPGPVEEWTQVQETLGGFVIADSPPINMRRSDPPMMVATTLPSGEAATGLLRSEPFTIDAPIQTFRLGGWDLGAPSGAPDGTSNTARLVSWPDGEVLRTARTPSSNQLAPMRWSTTDLLGRTVVVEVEDANARPDGFAWIAFADYNQEHPKMEEPVERGDIAVVDIEGAEPALCRSVPFQAVREPRIGEDQAIEVGAKAEAVLLLGLMNHGWDYALAHWGEHPETKEVRDDQIHPGVSIGEVEIHYEDGDVDRIPLVIGATAWFVAQWGYGPTHNMGDAIREPFLTRPDHAEVLARALRFREDFETATADTAHQRYLLSVEPQPKRIARLVVRDNEEKRGRPLVSGVTLVGASDLGPSSRMLPPLRLDARDIAPAFRSNAVPDFSDDIAALSRALHTREEDLPTRVEPYEPFHDIDAARLRFHAPEGHDSFDLAGMLDNIWAANVESFHIRFEEDTGLFRESELDAPWYGGYSGFGTWVNLGVYSGNSFGRCSDHYASLALRALANPLRTTNYVDYVDRWLTFFRDNNDPEKGIANDGLDASRWPSDAPGHWAFVIEGPLAVPWPINELQGVQEMDGHASTTIGRWWAWRLMGAPTDDWLMAPRDDVYGYSRWDISKQAADFICWLMDHTGQDAIYSEGESTGWGGGPSGTPSSEIPEGWHEMTDMDAIRAIYARGGIHFQTYPTYACMLALKASAEMADAAGKDEDAARWRSYAARIRKALVDEMAVGEPGQETWKFAHHSVFPSHNEAMVQAFMSIYLEGYDHNDWDPELAEITRRTLHERINRPNMGRAVIAMGYGQGWLLHSSLAFDELDASSRALRDLAMFMWDKNMDFRDEERGIDWRRWQWLLPEGVNVLPDGSWHRIGDLTNGANAGPSSHALLFSAGVDDTRPDRIRILPRVLDPMTGLSVENLQTVVAGGGVARVAYDYQLGEHFELSSDLALPGLEVRLGPFASQADAEAAIASGLPAGATTRPARSGTWRGADAWWLWVEGLGDRSELRLELASGR